MKVTGQKSGGGSAGRYYSPLRYPGGKGKIANFLKLVILENDLTGEPYTELYAGGASVALTLLFEEYSSAVHINDINLGVFAFWHSVLHETEALCRRVRMVPLNMREWDRQRAVQSATAPSLVDLGFSTFYLNRTNRSGIVAGGVIGGRGQGSAWGIDARFNRAELISRIEKIARFGSRITVSRVDAARLLSEKSGTRRRHQGLMYLDPPYYVKGRDLYEDWYSPADHRQIEELARALAGPVIVSYDAAPEVLKLYRRWPRIEYNLSYSASARYSGREVMFFGCSLKVPAVRRPTKIPSIVVQRAAHARAVGLG